MYFFPYGSGVFEAYASIDLVTGDIYAQPTVFNRDIITFYILKRLANDSGWNNEGFQSLGSNSDFNIVAVGDATDCSAVLVQNEDFYPPTGLNYNSATFGTPLITFMQLQMPTITMVSSYTNPVVDLSYFKLPGTAAVIAPVCTSRPNSTLATSSATQQNSFQTTQNSPTIVVSFTIHVNSAASMMIHIAITLMMLWLATV